MQCNALKVTLGSKAADSSIKKRIISTKGMVVLPLIMVMMLKRMIVMMLLAVCGHESD